MSEGEGAVVLRWWPLRQDRWGWLFLAAEVLAECQSVLVREMLKSTGNFPNRNVKGRGKVNGGHEADEIADLIFCYLVLLRNTLPGQRDTVSDDSPHDPSGKA